MVLREKMVISYWGDWVSLTKQPGREVSWESSCFSPPHLDAGSSSTQNDPSQAWNTHTSFSSSPKKYQHCFSVQCVLDTYFHYSKENYFIPVLYLFVWIGCEFCDDRNLDIFSPNGQNQIQCLVPGGYFIHYNWMNKWMKLRINENRSSSEQSFTSLLLRALPLEPDSKSEHVSHSSFSSQISVL